MGYIFLKSCIKVYFHPHFSQLYIPLFSHALIMDHMVVFVPVTFCVCHNKYWYYWFDSCWHCAHTLVKWCHVMSSGLAWFICRKNMSQTGQIWSGRSPAAVSSHSFWGMYVCTCAYLHHLSSHLYRHTFGYRRDLGYMSICSCVSDHSMSVRACVLCSSWSCREHCFHILSVSPQDSEIVKYVCLGLSSLARSNGILYFIWTYV